MKGSLKGVPYLLAILTPAPSGPDKLEQDERTGETVNRHELSYMEHVKRYGELGWTDWCAVEIKDALADPRTEVIPLFHPDYAMDDFAGQLNVIPGLSAQNAKSIGGPGHFEKSILTVHELIQRDIVKKRRQAAQLQHESELVATLSSASRKLQAQVDLPEGIPHVQPEPEPTLEPAVVVPPEPEPESEIRHSQLPTLEEGQHHVFI